MTACSTEISVKGTKSLPDPSSCNTISLKQEHLLQKECFAIPSMSEKNLLSFLTKTLRDKKDLLLTITTTYKPATDLGFLLHKHPGRVQTFQLAFGKTHVFYPEATPERCTAALLLDLDSIGLVRGSNVSGFPLRQYVNDRPYVASSFLSVAIAQIYGSALAGRCKDRPELVNTPIPLRAKISALPCHGGEQLLRRLFEPLGYALTVYNHVLDEHFLEWGDSPYFTVTLETNTRLSDLLSHLYVLIPVLDDDKHYYVGEEEIEKLLRHGEGWLQSHPERELIVHRYLLHKRSLKDKALDLLLDGGADETDAVAAQHNAEEADIEQSLNLQTLRINAVLSAIRETGARRVLDLGCGEGYLLALLLREKDFTDILGMDVSHRTLEIAAERLHLDRMAGKQRERINLFHGSLLYRDPRLSGYDAAAVVEVIEHLDQPRLATFERNLFEFARPKTVIVTTPNIEYNIKWEALPAGHLRHKDHRFEWTRPEFKAWANKISSRFGYSVHFLPIGQEDTLVGPPSQMAVFTLIGT